MKKVLKFVKLASFVLLMTLCVHSTLNAQTPADDPLLTGGGGPGAGVAPAGEGGPVVPFDGEMNLLFAASGILFVSLSYKKQKLAFLIK